MANSFNYALVLAVTAEDKKALQEVMKVATEKRSFRTTICQVQVDPQFNLIDGEADTDITCISFAQAIAPELRPSSATLEFISLEFKDGMTSEKIKQEFTGGKLNDITKHSRHFSVFKIVSPK